MRPSAPLAITLLLLLGASGSPTAVVVARATTIAFPLVVEGLGTARANESVDIRPEVSKSIRAIHFEEGERVEAGQLLVQLDNAEALADVAEARANLVDFENQVRRARELFESRTVSESERDQRIAQRDAARAKLGAAEARLAHADIRAPFAGRLGLRHVSLGSLVTPATVITTLDDTGTIKLDFDVPETSIARLATDLPVEARSAAWPDTTFRGRVATIGTRVDPVSRTVTVRARVPNGDGRLRPGMFLTVALLREDVTALVVPEQAVVPEQSRQFVFVVGEDQTVIKREVRTGRRRPGLVEILAGITEGEQVIVEGTQKVRPGGAVLILREIDSTRAAVPGDREAARQLESAP
ncbi:MAG: efflux RND transporter periplasmic adaptor subunit [Deltaproteobacteria bacterium]|nr:efflux RND transporter periplasmic adaptor subunit [Deltaproteobacteria bacterium]MBW2395724.1 efflux RND transporter periplasmic adaptor subunit [Deltaproteobacteria bacterium]